MDNFLAFLIALVLSGLQAITGTLSAEFPTPQSAPSEQVRPAPALEEEPAEPADTAEPPAPTPTPPPPPPAEESVAVLLSSKDFPDALEEEILVQTNVERVKHELTPLEKDSSLSLISRKHSLDMLIQEYFSHEDEDGCSSSCRAQEAEYEYQALGENIFLMKGFGLSAKNAASLIVQGWMGSPGHRANILREYNTHSGVGVAIEDGTIYATAMYSLPR